MIAWLASVSVRGLLRLARSLPRSMAAGVGAGLGRIAWAVDARHRSVARRNLARVHGRPRSDPWVRRATRDVFAETGRSMAEAAWLMGQSEEVIRDRVRVEGYENGGAAWRAGHGVVAAVAHAGPWEVLAAIPLLLPDVRFGTMARAVRNPAVDRVVRSLRERFGVEVFGIPGGTGRRPGFYRRAAGSPYLWTSMRAAAGPGSRFWA